ncbi:MAG TPA: MarR family winged helix-turn-helix transcriptional regulator [Rhabdochlamydiaceae bacterium]
MSEHPASEENLGFLLWQVSTLWSSSTAAALKQFGLTHPHFVILATIDWLTGKGASQEQIGRHTVLDPKPTAHLLRSLQVKGLVEPSDTTDEKNRFPLLTNAGKEMLAKVLPVIESADAAFFASLEQTNSKMVTALQILARANFPKHGGESCCLSEDDGESCGG